MTFEREYHVKKLHVIMIVTIGHSYVNRCKKCGCSQRCRRFMFYMLMDYQYLFSDGSACSSIDSFRTEQKNMPSLSLIVLHPYGASNIEAQRELLSLSNFIYLHVFNLIAVTTHSSQRGSLSFARYQKDFTSTANANVCHAKWAMRSLFLFGVTLVC
ncbi:hypothetical protein L7F22_036064 [Adiantum nelumboides]|nr:hypothetical protein [Adiantum nelumboides]